VSCYFAQNKLEGEQAKIMKALKLQTCLLIANEMGDLFLNQVSISWSWQYELFSQVI